MSQASSAVPAASQRPNRVVVRDDGPCRKRLSIEIPAETVDEHLAGALDALMHEADVPGFRRGRAPKRLVERRFGPGMRETARAQLIAAAYSKALEDEKLRVLGDPISDDAEKLELRSGHPLAFEVTVEVLPEFELPTLDAIPVRRPVFTITDEQASKEIERFGIQEGELEPRPQAEPGDYLTGHAKATLADGTVVIDINGAVIQSPTPDKNGQGMIVGLIVTDFAAQLGAPRPGDTVTIRTTGPENHENEALRGVPVSVTFVIDRIDRIIPMTPEALAARAGLPDVAALRERIRHRLEQRAIVEQQTVMRQQLARHLLESVPMQLPERTTAVQAARNLERHRLELMYRGVDPMKIEEQLARLRAASTAEAIRELKLFFILDKVANQLEVSVSNAEVNGRIAMMAQERGERPERLRQQLDQQGQLSGIYQQVREHKTMDAILAKAAITDVPAEEFNRLMAEAR